MLTTRIQLAAARARDQPLARLLFAAISAREGWAVYLETELMPHLPPSAQIFALRAHLLRTARTIIEPELREGTRTTASAARLLGHEVGHSDRAAGQEIERLLLMPGQAPSYLDGYLRQIELRTETELALGRRFARRDYHDLVLSQGFIPLSRLRERVLAELIPDAMHALAA